MRLLFVLFCCWLLMLLTTVVVLVVQREGGCSFCCYIMIAWRWQQTIKELVHLQWQLELCRIVQRHPAKQFSLHIFYCFSSAFGWMMVTVVMVCGHVTVSRRLTTTNVNVNFGCVFLHLLSGAEKWFNVATMIFCCHFFVSLHDARGSFYFKRLMLHSAALWSGQRGFRVRCKYSLCSWTVETKRNAEKRRELQRHATSVASKFTANGFHWTLYKFHSAASYPR